MDMMNGVCNCHIYCSCAYRYILQCNGIPLDLTLANSSALVCENSNLMLCMTKCILNMKLHTSSHISAVKNDPLLAITVARHTQLVLL